MSRYSRKLEWHIKPRTKELDNKLLGIPGVRWTKKQVTLHRSHLPLIGSPLQFEGNLIDWSWSLTPKPHQIVGAKFITGRYGSLIADEPRTGKTLTALMGTLSRGRQLIIVCPKSVIPVWQEWIQREGFPYKIASGRKLDPKIITSPILIINYDILPTWQWQPTDLGSVIFDEAHLLSGEQTLRSRAARFISRFADEHIVCLTGTPLWNEPANLHNMLDLCAPTAWGTYFDFGRRYSNYVMSEFGGKFEGTNNEEEFKKRLDQHTICRTIQDVYGDIPIQRERIIMKLTPQDIWKIDMVLMTETDAISKLTKLRTALVDRRCEEALKFLVTRTEPTVVWTWHVELAKTIAEKTGGFVITGATSAKKREKILKDWKLTQKPLCITLGVGQLGIDLSHSSVNLFVELDWTPSIVSQAEMRIFSFGKKLVSHFIVSDMEIEFRMIERLLEKMKNANQLGIKASISNFTETF